MAWIVVSAAIGKAVRTCGRGKIFWRADVLRQHEIQGPGGPQPGANGPDVADDSGAASALIISNTQGYHFALA
jgi:hypothetical protein